MFKCQKCGVKTSRWKRCDEHYACDDCGTREGLCFYSEGVRCGPCHEIRVEDRVSKFKGDTSYTDEITCPYCGYQHRDSWEMSEGNHECPDCCREYEISRSVQVSYTTTKLPENSSKE